MHDAWNAYWSALERGDRHSALEVVRSLQALDPIEVIDALIVPAQARIGELRIGGDWTAAQEHVATAINEGLVHWLCSFAPTPSADAPLVLVSCMEEERHALPALVVAEALGLAGYRVHYAGGGPEPGDLLRQVLVLKPRAVHLSASLSSTLGRHKGLFSSIRAIGIPVIVGGAAFGGDERRALALGATAYAADVEHAVRLLDTLPGRVPPATPPPPTEAEVEAARLLQLRPEITPYVARAIARRHDPAGTRPAWWSDLESHLDHVLGCLASSLVTGDETILIEARDWLHQVLTKRHAPEGLADDVWHALAKPLRGQPLARVHLAGAALPGARPASGPTEASEGFDEQSSSVA